MAEAALGIYVVWAGLAFGARSILHNRQTGDSGLRLHADPMTPAWFAKIGFVLAAATGLGAPIAALAGSEDLSLLQSPAIQSAGVIAAVLGATATVWAQDTMGTSWRVGVDVGERTELVVNGPFTISRNPIFAAMALTGLGLMLMVPNILSLVGVVALVTALEVQVRLVEEPYLLTVHGERYEVYQRSVPRFVPALRRRRSLR